MIYANYNNLCLLKMHCSGVHIIISFFMDSDLKVNIHGMVKTKTNKQQQQKPRGVIDPQSLVSGGTCTMLTTYLDTKNITDSNP